MNITQKRISVAILIRVNSTYWRAKKNLIINSFLKNLWNFWIFHVPSVYAQETVVHPNGWSFSFLFLLSIEQQETQNLLLVAFVKKMAPQIFVGIFPPPLLGVMKNVCWVQSSAELFFLIKTATEIYLACHQ